MKSYSLSPAQQRMLFLENINDGDSAYLVTIAFKIQGALNCDKLIKAYQHVIAKHALLRTGFFAVEGVYQQTIHPQVDFTIDMIDANDADAILAQACKHCFCLEKPPLLKVTLIRVNEAEFILVNTLHHVIVDGWSLKLMFQDLTQAYQDEGNLTLPHYTYFDVVNDQDHIINQPKEEDFWINYLKNVEYTEIYPDHIRKPERSPKAKVVYHLIDQYKTTALEQLAHENGVTLYVLLLSLFSVVYAKFTGSTTFCIGTPVANRVKEEYESIFGLFVNTLPIKINFQANDSFLDILKSNFKHTLDAFSHQSFPFDQIVNLTCEHRSIAQNPLFQPMFVLQENVTDYFQLPHLVITEFDPYFFTTRFDLESNFWRNVSGLKWRMIYDETLYDEKSIHNYMRFFDKVVQQVLENPRIKFSEFDMLSAIDRLELLKYGHGIKMPHVEKTIIDCLQKTTNHYALFPAVEFESQVINYHDFNIYYRKFMTWLDAQDKSSDVIALIIKPSIEMAVAVVGIMAGGYTLLPINPEDPSKRKAFILQDANAGLIVSQRDLLDGLPKTNSSIACFDSLSDLAESLDVAAYRDVKENSLAYILYTSGTTGHPKGVMVTHKNLMHTLTATQVSFQFNHNDIFTSFALFSFDIFYFEFFSVLLCGGKVRVTDKSHLLNAPYLMSIIQNTTAFQAVPSLVQQFLNVMRAEKMMVFPTMRKVTTGGEIVHPSLLVQLKKVFPNAEVSVTYGPTEGTIVCTKYTADVFDNTRCFIGKPLANVELRLYDKFMALVPVGVPGEIYIAGGGVSKGYINQPTLTQTSFVTIDTKVFYKTGDLARWNHAGDLEFLGRADYQIKLRGYRIELDAISSNIMLYPAISEACTLLSEHNANREIVSFVALKTGDESGILQQYKEKQVVQWRCLFDDTHLDNASDELYDFTGWKSIITGENIPIADMHAWLEGTVEAILSQLDISKKLRILEIGCGTGLVLMKLQAYSYHYDAIDFSASVLHSLQHKINQLDLTHVHLQQCSAENAANLMTHQYDLIVINSVIQYFPSVDYLQSVIASLSTRLVPAGCLFIGDVRDYQKLPHLYTEMVEKNPKTQVLTNDRKLALISKKIQLEQELCIAPDYFKYLSQTLNLAVQIEPRSDKVINELSLYRYNVAFKKALHDFVTDGHAMITHGVQYTTPIRNQLKRYHQMAIKAHLRQHLPEYMVPRTIEILDDLPLTSHGKINKKCLLDSLLDSTLGNMEKQVKTSTEKVLHQVVGEILGHNDFSIHDNFFDIGGTSLLAIQLSAELRKFNVVIKAQLIFKFQQLSELAAEIDRDNSSTMQTVITDKVAITACREKIAAINHARTLNANHALDLKQSTVFLLGATGYLGSHILHELVQQGCETIYCLVRASSKKLSERYAEYFKQSLPSAVKIISGDMAHFRLGLSPAHWELLVNQCDLVINAAANVRHVAHKESIYAINYYGVKELIQFAVTGREKYFYQLSTIGVKGLHADRLLKFSEGDLELGQQLTEDYSQSKFQAEKLVLDYMEQGGKAAIVRVGTIAPHATQAYFQHNIEEHFLTRFMQSTVACGVAGHWNTRMLALTPVNSLARALLVLITHDRHFTAITHLMTPHEISYLQLVEALKSYGYLIEILSNDAFKALVNSKISRENLTGIIQLLDSDKLSHVAICCQKTTSILERLGFYYPKIEAQWLMQFVQYCENIKFLPTLNKEMLCVD